MHVLSILLQDMIHIADTKVARRYGDFFIRNIHKFDEVCIWFNFFRYFAVMTDLQSQAKLMTLFA